jgi:hypothetical protein
LHSSTYQLIHLCGLPSPAADRRADNLTKSIAALEERVEALNDSKANLADVVLTVDLEALLAAHSSQLDGHLAAQKEEIMRVGGERGWGVCVVGGPVVGRVIRSYPIDVCTGALWWGGSAAAIIRDLGVRFFMG